jgi:hypothetical protein
VADDKTDETTTPAPGWSQPEYSPGANPHNDGSENPLGLAPVAQEIPQPPGAETGHKATDRGGAASGAGAGSRDDKSDLKFKTEQAEAVTGQPPADAPDPDAGGKRSGAGGSGRK